MGRRQLNVRLTPDQHDVIQAAVFVRELRSPQSLFDGLLEQLATELMEDSDIAAAVALRKKGRADSVVRELPKSRSRRQSDAGPRVA